MYPNSILFLYMGPYLGVHIISGVTSKVTLITTLIRGLITPLITTLEPPSRVVHPKSCKLWSEKLPCWSSVLARD